MARGVRIILKAVQKPTNKVIAGLLGISAPCVTRWTQRWEQGQEKDEPVLSRLVDLPRSGRPSDIEPEQLCRLVALACEDPQNYARPITHWSRHCH